jgi:hypothetical protein
VSACGEPEALWFAAHARRNVRRSARRQSAGAALRLSHRVLREPRRTSGWRDGRPAQLRAGQRSRQPWLEAGAARVREEAGGVNAVPDCVRAPAIASGSIARGVADGPPPMMQSCGEFAAR